MGVFAYTELTSRLVSLETSRELFENDLLKKSEQVPVDQEQHFLLEDLYKSVEKMEETQEMNMTNKVNIEFLRDQLEKALSDIEDLKDKVRAIGEMKRVTRPGGKIARYDWDMDSEMNTTRHFWDAVAAIIPERIESPQTRKTPMTEIGSIASLFELVRAT